MSVFHMGHPVTNELLSAATNIATYGVPHPQYVACPERGPTTAGSFSNFTTCVNALRNAGAKVIPALRMTIVQGVEGALNNALANWWNPAVWQNRADMLEAMLPYFDLGDRRLMIDIEGTTTAAYTTKPSGAAGDGLNYQDPPYDADVANALFAAAMPFGQVVRENNLELIIYPGRDDTHQAHYLPNLALMMLGRQVRQKEAYGNYLFWEKMLWTNPADPDALRPVGAGTDFVLGSLETAQAFGYQFLVSCYADHFFRDYFQMFRDHFDWTVADIFTWTFNKTSAIFTPEWKDDDFSTTTGVPKDYADGGTQLELYESMIPQLNEVKALMYASPPGWPCDGDLAQSYYPKDQYLTDYWPDGYFVGVAVE